MATPVLWNDVETESLVDCVGSFPHAGLQLEALRVCDLGIPLVVWYHTKSPEEKLFTIYKLKIMLESNVPGCEGRSLALQRKVTIPTTMKTSLEILGRKLVFLQGNIRQAFTKRRDLLVLRSS